MPTALFISPHLDDVAFSCGGLAALLAGQGWHTILATVFTRSVVPATGFALACQLDKGLPPGADYMALRRQEDLGAAAHLAVAALHWLDLPEAPHRGYETAAALFGAVHAGDDPAPVIAGLSALAQATQPDLVLAPQGLGNHVDHQIVIAAVQAIFPAGQIAYYRDTPYAIRQPLAVPLACVPQGPSCLVRIASVLDAKIAASAAYASQIVFQFGGADALTAALRGFALQEGAGAPAERFLGAPLPLTAAGR